MLSDKELVNELADYGFTFVDASSQYQRMERAPIMILSTPGGNTPLVKIFTFEFRYENPKDIDAPAAMRHAGATGKESLWVDFSYNYNARVFEVNQSIVRISPKGIPIPAYRAMTLLNRKQPLNLLTTGEVYNTVEEYEALPLYKQKEFDIEFVGPLMVERIRRFLAYHNYHMIEDHFKDHKQIAILKHELSDRDKVQIIKDVENFIYVNDIPFNISVDKDLNLHGG